MIKTLIKWGVISAVVLGLCVFFFGRDRMENAYHSVKTKATEGFDAMLDPKVVLERELARAQKEYPDNIAEVKLQIRDLERMIADNKNSLKVYENVIGLCDEDIEVLEAKLQRVDDIAANTVAFNPHSATVEFKGVNLNYAEALAKVNHAAGTKLDYQQKIDGAKDEVGFLEQQINELKTYQVELEKEYQQFMQQVGTLRREVEMIDRNDKLIAMVKKADDLRNGLNADGGASLHSIKNKIDEKKLRQQELLKGYKAGKQDSNEYETQARLELAKTGGQ